MHRNEKVVPELLRVSMSPYLEVSVKHCGMKPNFWLLRFKSGNKQVQKKKAILDLELSTSHPISQFFSQCWPIKGTSLPQELNPGPRELSRYPKIQGNQGINLVWEALFNEPGTFGVGAAALWR